MKRYSVLIADDHYVVRLGLKTLINAIEDFVVKVEAENGRAALAHVKEVDYLILDLKMPEVDGITVLKRVKKQYPLKKVIILTNTMDIPTLISVHNLKPDGLLFKDGMLTEIKECLYNVKMGHSYKGKNCLAFFERNKEAIRDIKYLMHNLNSLTKTELKVLSLITENLSTSEIAETLFNSPKTIENHRTNISRKLDVRGHNSLQSLAIKHSALIKSMQH